MTNFRSVNIVDIDVVVYVIICSVWIDVVVVVISNDVVVVNYDDVVVYVGMCE